MPHILAIDIGTSSVRAALYDERARRAGNDGEK
jgi:sugar (pentulose or hexulose) kinase